MPRLISRRLYNVVLTGIVLLSFVVMAASSHITATADFQIFVGNNALTYSVATIVASIVGIVLMNVALRAKENLPIAVVGYALFALSFGFAVSFVSRHEKWCTAVPPGPQSRPISYAAPPLPVERLLDEPEDPRLAAGLRGQGLALVARLEAPPVDEVALARPTRRSGRGTPPRPASPATPPTGTPAPPSCAS